MKLLKKTKYLAVMLLFSVVAVSAQQDPEPAIKDVFQEAKEGKWASLPQEEIIIKVAEYFLDTKYVGGTLDRNPKEALVINLLEQDCTTYLEYVLAFTLCIREEKYTSSDLRKALIELRYRCANIEGYLSRLHYFSDWIYDNARDQTLIDRSQELGGEKRKKQIDFMSNHVDSYQGLQTPEDLLFLAQIEDSLNTRTYYYIPKDKIKEIEANIHQGDIIAFTTSIEGLDIVHVGFAYWREQSLYLIHASSDLNKVTVSDKKLTDYVEGNEKQDGIMVLILR